CAQTDSVCCGALGDRETTIPKRRAVRSPPLPLPCPTSYTLGQIPIGPSRMKSISSQLTLFLQQRPSRRNIRILLRFFAILGLLVVIYSSLFHLIMLAEGRHF